MTTNHEVRCISRTDMPGAHERILSIGGASLVGGGPDGINGARWRMLQETAIHGIESKKWGFYVKLKDRWAMVVVASNLGQKYLKTEMCDLQPDNLLSLPECPQ